MGRTLHASLIEALGGDIGLSDLEAVRLLLRGSSVIDWNRANFRSYEEVDRFFSLHQFLIIIYFTILFFLFMFIAILFSMLFFE